VQFRATYLQHGQRGVLAETSRFVRQGKHWIYALMLSAAGVDHPDGYPAAGLLHAAPQVTGLNSGSVRPVLLAMVSTDDQTDDPIRSTDILSGHYQHLF
jgi:hypothetical protein